MSKENEELIKELKEQAHRSMVLAYKFRMEAENEGDLDLRGKLIDQASKLDASAKATVEMIKNIELSNNQLIKDIFKCVLDVIPKFLGLGMIKGMSETAYKMELNAGLPQQKTLNEIKRATIKDFM